MKYYLILLFRCLLNAFYWFLKLFIRPKNKITFFSRQSNEKSLDLELLSAEIKRLSPETKQVFRLKMLEPGLGNALKYAFHILGDMCHLAGSNIAVCDTYSIAVSFLKQRSSLKVFQIWHALGATKKFGLQSLGKEEGRGEKISIAMGMHKNYTAVFAPSLATAEFYKEAFGVGQEQIKICSLPHVDKVLDGESKKTEFLEQNENCKGKKIVFYLPTFRNGEEKIVNSLKERFGSEEEYRLITSLHLLSRVDRTGFGYNGNFTVFDVMKFADVVITDYSACAYEAALLGKKVYFFVPDYENYINNRGLNVDLKKELDGCVFEDVNELCSAIKSDNYEKRKIAEFADKYVTVQKNCTENMAKEILK